MCQFAKTKETLEIAVDGYCTETWFDWMLIPDNLKAAALYVHFYPQITLAWKKYQLPYIEEENAVSTVLQHLIKNADIIVNDRKRYTQSYIYTVAKNAIYPLGRIKRDYEAWNGRRSLYDYDEDLFDANLEWEYGHAYVQERCVDTTDVLTQILETHRNAGIWELIDSLDGYEFDYVSRILGGEKLGSKLTKREPEILASLRIKFARFVG